MKSAYLLPLGAALFACAANSHADTLGTSAVNATAVIYYPGNAAAAASAGGTAPGFISVVGISSITFTVSGTITLNGGGNFNDADGNNSGVGSGTSSNTGTASYGGITALGAGYLTGLFVGSSTTPGAATSYTTTASENAASYSPTQNQAFFIGDGVIGDGTSPTSAEVEQTFNVPVGATMLYLGISDAGGYNGGPGSYGDNSGSYSVSYDEVLATTPTPTPTPSTTPEPSSLILLGTGVLGLAGAAKRRIRA